MNRREEIEWCDVWITNAQAEGLPRALLVGDSMTHSYYPTVAAELRGRFNCARLTTSKCVCDTSFRRELDLVLADYRFAVIHFNNGLHGWDYTEAEFASALPPILDVLRAAAPLIWASSTPMRKASDLAAFDEQTARVRQRNQLAAAAATARQIPINDLFALSEEHPEYYSADGVHFQDAGRQVLGRQVARFIQQF